MWYFYAMKEDSAEFRTAVEHGWRLGGDLPAACSATQEQNM